ncbi:hypothetical protein [Brevundimonas diminuta]|uniref:hypothetical protein n=1 Tax=Brevundimonas diminuta TaxID=293 RepID=UPI003D9A967A
MSWLGVSLFVALFVARMVVDRSSAAFGFLVLGAAALLVLIPILFTPVALAAEEVAPQDFAISPPSST